MTKQKEQQKESGGNTSKAGLKDKIEGDLEKSWMWRKMRAGEDT